MKPSAKSLLLLTLVAAMGMSASSCKKGQTQVEERPAQVVALLKNLERIDLSDEQATKIEGIASQFSIKIGTARRVLGPAASRIGAARTKAAKEGKKGKELQEAALAGASAQEKAYYIEFQAAVYEFRKAVADVLTAEQREKVGLILGSDGYWKLRVE